MPKPVTLLRAVVISPGDVLAERKVVEEVLKEVNRDQARPAELHIELWRWEADAHAGFHPEGPQGLIDPILQIADCDLVILILWSRLGTPTPSGRTGTEHEFLTAYLAWREKQQPQIMAYFCDRPTSPASDDDRRQIKWVEKFKVDFPSEGLSCCYTSVENFREVLEKDLRNYLNGLIRSIWSRDASSVREMLAERKRGRRTVAVLGRVSDDGPKDQELIGREECTQALFHLGTALQRAGYRLMVYDSREDYAANQVIRGYLAGDPEPRSIRVRRPLRLRQEPFPGQETDPDLFVVEPRRKEQWEFTFIDSLSDLDGAIAVGNGYFTLIGGLQAVGARLPILALGGFGGVASEIWEALSAQRSRFANDRDVELMGGQEGTAEWAEACVRSLDEQRKRRDALQIWQA